MPAASRRPYSAPPPQLPAVWLLATVTVALFGLAPRFSPAAWAVLVGFIALYMLGSLSGFPQWLNLEPFSHIPRVGAGSFTAVPRCCGYSPSTSH